MISRFLSIFVLAVAACLPVLAWTFVAKTSRLNGNSNVYRISTPMPSQLTPLSFGALGDHRRQGEHALAFTQPPFGLDSCRLRAKGDADEDVDPFDADDWEGNEVEEELDLDDVESSVAGTDEDEDDIDYEDEDDNIDGDEDDVEDDDDIDEKDEDEDIDEEDDEDYDAEGGDIDAYLKGDGGMDEKPPEGYSKWWEDYGFKSREAFDNHELFPGGMKGLITDRMETPDEDFWDDETTMVPLEESPDDPDYNEKLKLVQENSAKRQAAANANTVQYKYGADIEVENELETIEELSELLDEKIPNDTDEEEFTIDASEFEGMDIEQELEGVTALIDDEPYISANRTNIAGTGITDEEMEALDQSWKNIDESLEKEPWNKVAATQFNFNYSAYPKQYHYDMQQTAVEIESAGYDVFPWLKYDMGFNVSNLILASIKHNPDAPVILQHWYPQVMVCERYQHARDRNFDFTWDDVNNADMEELKRYYYGFGYEEIPKKAPAETGMISFEDADEQEVKMAAMEKWMLDVYNGEWDKKDFDDENIKDEDNVYSDNFKMPQHPDLPTWEEAQEDVAGWKDEYGEDEELDGEGIAYRDMMGRSVDYTSAQTDDFQKNFRGHLIVACGNFESDLDTAEQITARVEKEFGNAIYTETKIHQHATPADNIFEVWLESYEIDLLHSKRRAAMNVVGWEGKGEVDDDRIEYLVKEIGKLTCDDARTSFRWTEEHIS